MWRTYTLNMTESLKKEMRPWRSLTSRRNTGGKSKPGLKRSLNSCMRWTNLLKKITMPFLDSSINSINESGNLRVKLSERVMPANRKTLLLLISTNRSNSWWAVSKNQNLKRRWYAGSMSTWPLKYRVRLTDTRKRKTQWKSAKRNAPSCIKNWSPLTKTELIVGLTSRKSMKMRRPWCPDRRW